MTTIELGRKFKEHFGFNPPIDMELTAIKGPTNAKIDIIKLDEMFSQRDPEYDCEHCKYKDQNDVSMKTYIELKYGTEAEQFIRRTI